MDRLSGISTFVQAVEAGSFALAGERLGLTRSAVGKSIARLEQRLGVRLFQRSTRSQHLTDEGKAYYEHCLRALAELDTAEARLDSARREPSGRLRVSVSVLFGRRCVAPVLLDLARRHPQLALEVAFSDRRIDLLEDGFDLAVRLGDPSDRGELKARRLGQFNLVLCAAPAYLAEFGEPQSVQSLNSHQGIVYGRHGAGERWTLLDREGVQTPAPIASRLHFDDLQSIADACIAGAGIARLPRWLVGDELDRGSLRRVLPDYRSAAIEVHALWSSSAYMPLKLRAAIDALLLAMPEVLTTDSA